MLLRKVARVLTCSFECDLDLDGEVANRARFGQTGHARVKRDDRRVASAICRVSYRLVLPYEQQPRNRCSIMTTSIPG
jgi:hypothetical protein